MLYKYKTRSYQTNKACHIIPKQVNSINQPVKQYQLHVTGQQTQKTRNDKASCHADLQQLLLLQTQAMTTTRFLYGTLIRTACYEWLGPSSTHKDMKTTSGFLLERPLIWQNNLFWRVGWHNQQKLLHSLSKNVKSGPKIDHMHTKRDINNKHFIHVSKEHGRCAHCYYFGQKLIGSSFVFRIMYYASCYTEIMGLWTIYTEIHSTHVSIFHCLFITLCHSSKKHDHLSESRSEPVTGWNEALEMDEA